jgi:dTDP-4-amino-4,6-dideoxygalactose transaminase
MYKQWPLGQLPVELQRPELQQIKNKGYSFINPAEVVDIFEKKVADFCGSKFAVAVDCCSNAIFLILKYIDNPQKIKIPYYTYASVPMQILHAGYQFEFIEKQWSGTYDLEPLNVWDAAGRWTKGMYTGGFMSLSFQIKKRLPIGRGGMILCDDYEAYKWFKKACYDGRDLNKNYLDDDIEMLGWHMYMTPEDAARGILLMDNISEVNEDSHNHTSYKDLRDNKIFNAIK